MKTKHRTTRISLKGVVALIAMLTVVFAGLTLFGSPRGMRGTVLAAKATAEPVEEAPTAGSGATAHDEVERPAAIAADKDPGEASGGIFMNDTLESLALSLKKKEQDLKEREEALIEETKRLESLRAEVEQNLAKMEQTLKKMESLAAQADASREDSLGQWIEIYQTMEPADVAKIIEGVEEDFAIRLLSEMVPKKAGEVLSVISPETSIKLSKHLTGRK